VCYNGDIRTPEDAFRICDMFSDVQHIMIGRGLVSNPALAKEIRRQSVDVESVDSEKVDVISDPTRPDNELMREFVDTLWREYSEIFSGERDVLFKMKELWFHMGSMYPEYSKQLDAIKKCRHADEYHEQVRKILDR
jgi:tRNA-dihydrouridine synthase